MKSWKLVDCDTKTKSEYNTVINISKDITCTRPLIVDIIAYLDWLTRPNIEKKILDHSINIKWYSTIESTDSTINKLGPHIKFKLNSICVASSNDKNMGAAAVVGLGIRKISLVSILNRSATIWNAPFLPIKVGPIRLWEKANSLRSVKITNKASKTHIREISKANSWMFFKNYITAYI